MQYRKGRHCADRVINRFQKGKTMEKTKLINECSRLINQASTYNSNGIFEAADTSLAELRELLNLEDWSGKAPDPGDPGLTDKI